jgi:hypothetical protein
MNTRQLLIRSKLRGREQYFEVPFSTNIIVDQLSMMERSRIRKYDEEVLGVGESFVFMGRQANA